MSCEKMKKQRLSIFVNADCRRNAHFHSEIFNDVDQIESVISFLTRKHAQRLSFMISQVIFEIIALTTSHFANTIVVNTEDADDDE